MKNNFNLPWFFITYFLISCIVSGGEIVSPIELVSGLWFMASFGFWVPEFIAIWLWFIGVLAVSLLGGYIAQKITIKILNK